MTETMTKKLEPNKECPFCGETPSTGLCGDRVMHDCKSLGAFISCTVEGWNTRYKRTCHSDIKTEPSYYEGGCEYDDTYYCSECGDCWGPCAYKFCPNCGAEVVDA